MSANTVTVWEGALKQGWTQNTLEKQYSDNDAVLEGIEKASPEQLGGQSLGKEAITPVWTGHGGGYSVAPPTGSNELNSADAEDVNQAKWKYRRHYSAIELDSTVVTQSENSAVAVAAAVDTEIEGKIGYTRKQIVRQLFGDQTALIAQCAKEEEEKTTVKLLATGMGYQAIRNGWLVAGQEIDIGSKTEEAKVVDKKAIVSVTESESAPAIVLASKVKTAETDYVSIANARAGETSYEINGLKNIVSTTATLGELKPETAPGWVGVVEPAKGAVISRALVTNLRRRIQQKGGPDSPPNWGITSLKQLQALENEIYAHVRFASPEAANTGTGEHVMVGDLRVEGHQDCPDAEFHLLNKKHLFALRSNKPEWMPEKYGQGGVLEWKQGTTFLVSTLEYLFEAITNRRNVHGRLTELA